MLPLALMEPPHSLSQTLTFSELVHTPAGAIPVGLVLNVEAVTGLTGVAVGE